MNTPPPRWFRRLILTPIVFVVALVLVVLAPVLHLAAALIDLVFDRRRWRVSRFVGVGLAFCAVEVFGLFALFTVWVGSGFGLFMKRARWVRANTLLTGQYFELVTRAIRFFLGFRFSYTHETVPAGPQLLLARHAGPGDAFLIAKVVIRDQGRRLRMVGAAKLRWDPFLDIIGERLGHHYLQSKRSGPNGDLDAVRDISSHLEPDETLVIFPEGGNYTPQRREQSIARLVELGRLDDARRATDLRHTLLPRLGGICAAINGARDAVVVFAAHVGLENLYGMRDLWESVPLQREMVAHAWPAGGSAFPSSAEAQATWVFDQWEAVDAWIDWRLRESTPVVDDVEAGVVSR